MKNKLRIAGLGLAMLLGVALASALPVNATPASSHGWNKPNPTIPGLPYNSPYIGSCPVIDPNPLCPSFAPAQ